MHVLNYEVKRAHWRLTWWAIREFRKCGKMFRWPDLEEMTAARYDILFAIAQRPRWAAWREDEVYEMRFDLLVAKLGLHPSTVSKCLKRLVALGWMTRHVVPYDRRRRIFRLTALGHGILGVAEDVLFGDAVTAYFEANTTFAEGAAVEAVAPAQRPLGEHLKDEMLIRFGRRARQCATGLGSTAWPIFDPHFEDPQFLQFAAA